MRRTQRRHPHEATGNRKPRGGTDAGDVDRQRVVEGRQQPGEPAGEHGLARTRRPDEQHVMPTSRGHFDGEARHRVAPHVGEIGVRLGVGHRWWRRRVGPRLEPADGVDHGAECGCGAHFVAADGQRLVRGGRGHDHGGGGQGGDHRHDTGHPPQRPVEAELAEERGARDGRLWDLALRGEHADGDRQIEPGAHLADAGRRQVDRDALLRPRQPGGQQCGAHAVARLAARPIGLADDGEPGETVGHMDLDGDRAPIDTEHSCGRDRRKHDTRS